MLVLVAPIIAYAALTILPGGAGFVVTSGSMGPAIGAGSLIFVVDTGDYEQGDVISFRHDNSVVTHRIVESAGDEYVTAGDANDRPDGQLISDTAVIGEVVFTVPLYGYFLAFATSPVGYLGFVIVPGVLLVGLVLGDVRTDEE